MKRILTAAALASGLTGWQAGQDLTLAQTQAPAPAGNIVIDYVEPADPKRLFVDDKDLQAQFLRSKDIYDRMTKHRLLERYKEFLSPLRLVGTLRIRIKDCDEGAFFDRGDTSVTLCYDYIAGFEATAPKDGEPNKDFTPEGITYDDAVVGSIVGSLLHETGHALFYMFQIPVLGREEDAADQIAAFVMLQFGKDVGRMMIKGSLWKMHNFAGQNVSYWDQHSSPKQRFSNFICIAYGADPDSFKELITFLQPETRVNNCAREYAQVRLAFMTTVMPHIDEVLMQKILEKKWVELLEGK